MEVYAVSLLVFLALAAILDTGSCDGSTNVSCIESEKQALLRFKQGLIDPLERLSSWSASNKLECCNWTGIICDKLTGHVKELHLDNPYTNWERQMESEALARSELQGNISASLLDLKYLSYLDLSFNDFGGIPIPSFIGSLLSLTYLDLSKAGFEGLIPYQLGNLINLSLLRVPVSYYRANLHVENLNWLSNLSSLVHLDMSGVNLSAASDSLQIINKLPSLIELHLSNCGLVLMPSLSLVNLTSLQILEISYSYNFGSSIPKWIFSLSNLISLSLDHNYFEGPIPNSFSNLTSLKILDLSSNGLTASLPDSLFNLEGLVSLNLEFNSFGDGIPYGLKNLTALRNLVLGNIDFAPDTIPEWLYSLQDIEYLDLRNTNLQGEISNAIQNMTSLVGLELSNNKLEGTLPRTSIGYLNRLRSLHLRNNSLFGEIPETLANCKQLVTLDLGLNNFFGNIPAWLDNNLSGSIPRCLNNLTAMIDNPHSYYQLFHSLSFGNFMDEALVVMKGREAQYDTVLTMVTNLDFSSNKLSGEIPEEITALVELIGLNLSGNYLTGEIPKNTGNMQKLESVDLSRNQISGNIPPSLSRLIILSYLDLSYNNLSGQILHSTQLQTFPASRFIGNRLCGPPLTENWSSEITCPDDESGSENAESGSEEEGYFVSMAFGFGMAFGFWWILCPLLFSRRWRYSYYAFLNRMWNSLYIKFAIARRGNI
ncbi:receptor-like protein EIX1 isoform X2 [Mercurialis annua]|uniref:receptor-like protein EIX1 isoform X2 n=1 Tax=Mercurialis annua TaxID=3986 RepID=UPI00215F44A2|nr:receptor-like protein EIX1 isoform X2 [Mercurialis annua]